MKLAHMPWSAYEELGHFAVWYRERQAECPDQFPDDQPPIRWTLAVRGWKYLTSLEVVPHAPIEGLGVPEMWKPYYDLNITLRPFIVTVGEVVTLLILTDMETHARDYIRRIRDVLGWPHAYDFDDGTMYHITLDYVRSVTGMGELDIYEDDDMSSPSNKE